MPAAAMSCVDDTAQANDADVYHQSALKRQHQLDIIKTLGEGTHGKVVLATDPSSMQQVTVYTMLCLEYAPFGSISIQDLSCNLPCTASLAHHRPARLVDLN